MQVYKRPSQNSSRFYLRKLYLALILVLISIVVGVIGYMLIEGYTLVEAFYMTIITLSTVGFTEVRKLSDAGRIFTSLLIIGNIGIFAYSISIVSRFLVEGDIKKIIRNRRMEQSIKKLKEHIIICGYGRYGHEVVDHFKKHNIEYVIVENEESVIRELEKDTDMLFVEGDATHDEVLQEAGIENAKSIITTLPDDAENMYVILSAKQLNADINVISRALNKKSGEKLKLAGADHVIHPEQIGGFYMATLVSKPDAVQFFTILTERGDVAISFEEVIFKDVPDEYKHKTIRELNIRSETGANVIGLKTPEGKFIVNPDPDIKLKPEMGIIVLGSDEQIRTFKNMMSKIVKTKNS